ncbi:hypothetical protein Scep_014758 [Stephania cephalantha]|uniref:Uncharacterized protein n=1 Tax=Stephania cephalantha TaxID=152367 RepID=A0AAP0J3Y6_9MAGN
MVWVQKVIDPNALQWRTQANTRRVEQTFWESIPWPKELVQQQHNNNNIASVPNSYYLALEKSTFQPLGSY